MTADPEWVSDAPGLVWEAIDGFLAMPMRGCAKPENCGAAGPCDGVNCGGDPSMIVSVTGTSGTINWCGETWNLPADSGLEKCICPIYYFYGNNPNTLAPPPSTFFTHKWKMDTQFGMNRELELYRWHWNQPFLLPGEYRAINEVWAKAASSFKRQGSFSTNTGKAIVGTPPSVIAAANATSLSYKILDNWFGTHTAGGITYSWARGNDWP